MQVAGLNVPEPAVRLQETVPVGVILAPVSESVIVAMQVVGAFTTSGEVQLVLVEEERLLTVRLKVPELGR